MKIKGSLEQAVCILLVIAHTKGHAPVKSYTLSELLGDVYKRQPLPHWEHHTSAILNIVLPLR